MKINSTAPILYGRAFNQRLYELIFKSFLRCLHPFKLKDKCGAHHLKGTHDEPKDLLD